MENNYKFSKIIIDADVYISSLQEKQLPLKRTRYYYAGLMCVYKREHYTNQINNAESYEFECFRQCRFYTEQNRDIWIQQFNNYLVYQYNEIKTEWDKKVSQGTSILKKFLNFFDGKGEPSIYVWIAIPPSVAKSFRDDHYRKKEWISFRSPNTQPEDYPNHDLYIIYYRKDYYRVNSHLNF